MTKSSNVQKITNKVLPVEKNKSFFHNATDTFHELFLWFAGVVVVGGGLYSMFESKSFFEGIWWALVTAFTVGYGDTVPDTAAGRVTGVVIMSLTVFLIIPLITARMASKMIVNNDAWTDKEQKDLMSTVKKMNKFLDSQNEPAKVKKPTKQKS